MEKKVCSICGKETIDYYVTGDDDIVCHRCANAGAIRRCSCGVWIRANKARCHVCEENIYRKDINGYSTKPIPQFKNFRSESRQEFKDQRYYGLELEYNNTDYSKVYSIGLDLYKSKLIYNKSDSSIGSGVEIVTSPMDRRSIKELMGKMEPIFEYVLKNNYKQGAGLHVHVSKNSISIPDQYKLCLLLNNSDVSTNEKRFMYLLSGRLTDITQNVDDHYFRIGTWSGWKCTVTGHDKALNTANNSTYEFRIFKSSANKDEILSYIEVVDKMIEFCHTHGLKDITIGKFFNWLRVNTSNKIIQEKIKYFISHECGLPNIGRLGTENYKEMLQGIKWQDYGRLVSAIQDSSSLRRAILFYKKYDREATKVEGIKCRDLQEKLLNTFRKTMINYILKNQDREEIKCA